MSNIIDLTGKRFSRLVVDKYVYTKNQRRWWSCRCDCGNECVVQTSSLINGITQSCGCLQKERTSKAKLEDLTGQTINGIYVESISEKKNGGRVHWNCICHCGNHFVVSAHNLKRGVTKSCGCTRYDKTHAKLIDLTGHIYNNLLVKSFVGKNKRNYIWKCECLLCGNECDIASTNLKNGHTASCGCQLSKTEEQIAKLLDDHNIRYQRQKTFIGCKNKKKLRFDFYLQDYGVAIEYDGEFHYNKIESRGNDLDYQVNNDKIKTEYCDSNDIILLRIPYWEKDNIESILSEWLNIDSAEEANSSSTGLSA